VNARLEQHFEDNFESDVHVLECLFHVNEIYFKHVIEEIEKDRVLCEKVQFEIE